MKSGRCACGANAQSNGDFSGFVHDAHCSHSCAPTQPYQECSSIYTIVAFLPIHELRAGSEQVVIAIPFERRGGDGGLRDEST
jgi:hypothetical protein